MPVRLHGLLLDQSLSAQRALPELAGAAVFYDTVFQGKVDWVSWITCAMLEFLSVAIRAFLCLLLCMLFKNARTSPNALMSCIE